MDLNSQISLTTLRYTELLDEFNSRIEGEDYSQLQAVFPLNFSVYGFSLDE